MFWNKKKYEEESKEAEEINIRLVQNYCVGLQAEINKLEHKINDLEKKYEELSNKKRTADQPVERSGKKKYKLDEYKPTIIRYLKKEIDAVEASMKLNLTRTTFHHYVSRYRAHIDDPTVVEFNNVSIETEKIILRIVSTECKHMACYAISSFLGQKYNIRIGFKKLRHILYKNGFVKKGGLWVAPKSFEE